MPNYTSSAKEFVDTICPPQKSFDFGFDYGTAIKSCGIQLSDDGMVLTQLRSSHLVILMKLVATCAISGIQLHGEDDYAKLQEFITKNRLYDDVGDVREQYLVQRLRDYFHV